MAQVQYQAVGRRKKAIARVRLVPGDGKVVINGRDIDNYFGLETLKMTVRQPLALTNLEDSLLGRTYELFVPERHRDFASFSAALTAARPDLNAAQEGKFTPPACDGNGHHFD